VRGVAAGSEAAAELLKRQAGDRSPPLPIAVIPQLGVHVPGAPEHQPHEGLAIGCVGRLVPARGVDTLLEALAEIRGVNWRLTVVGDGPWRGRLERAARPLGAAVRFVGYAGRERPGYYAGADIYLCPTTRASFGVTLLEAMACGTPLVVSDIPSFRDLAEESGALFAPRGEPAAWAAAVNGLFDDAARRAAMGKAGRAVAERYAWPVVARRVLEVYRRVTR